MIKFIKRTLKKLFEVNVCDLVLGPCFGGEYLTEEEINKLQEKINNFER